MPPRLKVVALDSYACRWIWQILQKGRVLPARWFYHLIAKLNSDWLASIKLFHQSFIWCYAASASSAQTNMGIMFSRNKFFFLLIRNNACTCIIKPQHTSTNWPCFLWNTCICKVTGFRKGTHGENLRKHWTSLLWHLHSYECGLVFDGCECCWTTRDNTALIAPIMFGIFLWKLYLLCTK